MAQTEPLSERIANAFLHNPEQSQPATWDEEIGTQLQGLDAEWYNTANGDYFHFVEGTVDAYLDARDAGRAGKLPDSPLAAGLLGRQLLLLYRVTRDERYYRAATLLRDRLALSCGVGSATSDPSPAVEVTTKPCSAEPFLAEYASAFDAPGDFATITRDFLKWDESGHDQPDASARLAAGLVDSLPYYPPDDANRNQLISILNRIAAAIANQQDRASGRFNEGPIRSAAARQPLPPTVAGWYIFALLKGVRFGYLPARYSAIAQSAWNRLQKNAGGAGRRSQAGTGALLLAATEMDLASTAALAKGQTVMVDAWYNSQQRRNAAGQMEYYHYKWSDLSDSGYSLLGHLFRSYGAGTATLVSAPTEAKLSHAQFYIIVSPDIPIKNPNPHYMNEQDAAEIASWVHDGGVLVLMENDPPNADISHLNLLADKFGIHFDDVLRHHIIGEQVVDGRIAVAAGGALFHHAHTLYMKDTCALSLRGTATALLRDRGDVVMATAKYGRGTVFAAVDPWVYNEYTDGRKDPEDLRPV